MRQRVFKFTLYALVLAGIFYACRQDCDELLVDRPFSVDDARAWYQAHVPDYLVLKSGKSGNTDKIAEPDWKSACKAGNGKVETVTVNLLSNGGFGFAQEATEKAFRDAKNPGYMISLTQLVILKNKKSGNVTSFLMTMVGDKAYLERKDFKLWKGNGYLKKDKDFSGLVLFHDLESRFVNGWRYTEGKVTHTVDLKADGDIPVRLKSGYIQCTIDYITFWYEVETEWYSIGEYGPGLNTDPRYEGSTYDYYTETIYYQQCEWVEDAGGYYGGDGSGSGYSELNSKISNINTLLGVNLTGPSDVPDKRYYIDLQTWVREGEMIAADQNGGFYYICKGQWVYVRDGEYYVDVTGQGDWYKATLVTSNLADEIAYITGRSVAEVCKLIGRILPAEDLYILITGIDFDNLESSRLLAGGFLLLEIIPGTKLMKPVENTLGDAIEYLFKFGDELLGLQKINGIITFTDETVRRLAARATQNSWSNMVMLGKENFSGTLSYFERAGNDFKYFRIEQNNWYNLFGLINSNVEEMWRINKEFIDNAFSSGNQIFLSHDPFNPIMRQGFYGQELDYIENVLNGRFEKIEDDLWKVIFD